MTNPTTPFDRALEQFKRNMQWSPQATETEKTLVLGNLNGFVAALNKTLMETTDAEILATVSPAQISEGHEIRRAALEWAADAIKAQDGGNMEAETGWKSDEALACWLTIRSMLEDAAQANPTFDPGMNAPCPFCLRKVMYPMKTISLLLPDDKRSYFYRAHKACYEGATKAEIEQIEGALIDTRASLKGEHQK